MEVEKGISEYGTYIHTNILNKIVKVPYNIDREFRS
jgi:hypothetical protein